MSSDLDLSGSPITDASGSQITDASGSQITDASGSLVTDASGSQITETETVVVEPVPPPIPEDVVSDEQKTELVAHMKSKYNTPMDLIDIIISGVRYVENLNLYLFPATKKTLVTESLYLVIAAIDLWAGAKESLKNFSDIVVGPVIDSVLENNPGRRYYDIETIDYLLAKIPSRLS